MDLFEPIFESARRAAAHIVLAEGDDPRVAQAAVRAARDGLARISVVSDVGKFRTMTAGLAGAGAVEVHVRIASPPVKSASAALPMSKLRLFLDSYFGFSLG